MFSTAAPFVGEVGENVISGGGGDHFHLRMNKHPSLRADSKCEDEEEEEDDDDDDDDGLDNAPPLLPLGFAAPTAQHSRQDAKVLGFFGLQLQSQYVTLPCTTLQSMALPTAIALATVTEGI